MNPSNTLVIYFPKHPSFKGMNALHSLKIKTALPNATGRAARINFRQF